MQSVSGNGAPPRSVRSYVLRAGRVTLAQQRALTELWPHYGVEFMPESLDLQQLFRRHAPCTLEIGFGDGEHLIERAAQQPERDFLGIEVHRPGIGHLLLQAARTGVQNLRVIAHDAVEVLERQIAANSLDEVQLLFPDPWPKKRHHKRRLLQARFIALLASKLQVGGHLHVATDWQPYAEQMLSDMSQCPVLQNCARDFSDAPSTRRPTRFQRRGERLGHGVRELLFIRIAAAIDALQN